MMSQAQIRGLAGENPAGGEWRYFQEPARRAQREKSDAWHDY
jgi:hypothetical protein